MPTFLVQSLGCKVSQYDGNRLEDRLSELGWTPAPSNAAPDLFVLNGCAVTARASQKVRQALRAAKRRWPLAKVVLSGCEARRRDLQDDLTTEADDVLPLMIPLEELRTRLTEWGFAAHRVVVKTPISRAEAGSQQISLSGERSGKIDSRIAADGGRESDGENHEGGSGRGGLEAPSLAPDAHFPHPEGRVRAFLKIQDGCTQFCTYCIVPHLRGPETSRPIDDCVAEARRIAAAGHSEIVLTGIHVGRYESGLVPLLKQLETIEGLERIRVSSIEPLEVGDDLIDWLAGSPKACPHLHVPLQAGVDEILASMNRPYRTAEFAALVKRIRARLPRIALTTDLIVGFPGESEEQFARGLAFVEAMAFSRLHIFRYSIRPGTPAATYANQIDGPEKQRRARAAEAVWHGCAEFYHRSFVGETVEVLWETCEDGVWQGTSREYLVCRRPTTSTTDLTGRIERVRVTAAGPVTVDVE